MTLRECVHLQNNGADADDLRRLVATLSGDSEGIIGSGDFLVSEKSGTPNMSVDVAAGRALVLGTEATMQGTYFCESDAVENLAITASDPTNPRKDLVVAQVEDAVYSGSVNAWKLAIVTGTPSGSPVEPSLPASSDKLAVIDVDAAVTSIVDAKITDSRTLWAQNRPSSILNAAAGFSWSSFTPSFTQGASLTTSLAAAVYMELGGLGIAMGGATFSSVGSFNKIKMALPGAGLATSAFYAGGSFFFNDLSTGKDYVGAAMGDSAFNDTVQFIIGGQFATDAQLGTTITIASGDAIRFFVVWYAG